MKLSAKELALIDKHDIDKIVFMAGNSQRVVFDLNKILEEFDKKNQEDKKVLRLEELYKSLSAED